MDQGQKKITEAYDASAPAYAEKCYHELDYKPLDRLLLDRFSALIPLGGLVGDIGCGPGEIADYLYHKKVYVMGIDIAGHMITEAQRLNHAIEFKTGEMFSPDLPDNYFSGICAFYAIVNFPYEDVRKILREYTGC